MRTATVRAHPNIAFIKYWGNEDNALKIPVNGSISMNLDDLYTETQVTWRDEGAGDTLILNGQSADELTQRRVSRHLSMLRDRLGIGGFADVVSSNNFPMGVGIASSAASFAALTVASAKAAQMNVDERSLTCLARIGSGSASRSVPTGFVEWVKGDSHESSYAYSLKEPNYWDLVDVIIVLSDRHKKVGSEDGHKTAQTSDLQQARVAGANQRLNKCRRAIEEHDFSSFADVVEQDSNLMHSVMMTSVPPLFYWLPATLDVMRAVREMRYDGINVCYTLDAGPNVHCLCLGKDVEAVIRVLKGIEGVIETRVAKAGGGTQVIGG